MDTKSRQTHIIIYTCKRWNVMTWHCCNLIPVKLFSSCLRQLKVVQASGDNNYESSSGSGSGSLSGDSEISGVILNFPYSEIPIDTSACKRDGESLSAAARRPFHAIKVTLTCTVATLSRPYYMTLPVRQLHYLGPHYVGPKIRTLSSTSCRL